MFYVTCALGTIIVASLLEAVIGQRARDYFGSRTAADFKTLKDELSKR